MGFRAAIDLAAEINILPFFLLGERRKRILLIDRRSEKTLIRVKRARFVAGTKKKGREKNKKRKKKRNESQLPRNTLRSFISIIGSFDHSDKSKKTRCNIVNIAYVCARARARVYIFATYNNKRAKKGKHRKVKKKKNKYRVP